MIAPYWDADDGTTSVTASGALRSARRAVASTLLASDDADRRAGQPVPAWQAWLIVIWMAATSAAYVTLLWKWWA